MAYHDSRSPITVTVNASATVCQDSNCDAALPSLAAAAAASKIAARHWRWALPVQCQRIPSAGESGSESVKRPTFTQVRVARGTVNPFLCAAFKFFVTRNRCNPLTCGSRERLRGSESRRLGTPFRVTKDVAQAKGSQRPCKKVAPVKGLQCKGLTVQRAHSVKGSQRNNAAQAKGSQRPCAAARQGGVQAAPRAYRQSPSRVGDTIVA